jgi:hypothetical protein
METALQALTIAAGALALAVLVGYLLLTWKSEQ